MPKSPTGKARSAMNALTHGFTSKSIIIPIGMEEEFECLHQALRSETKPLGELEEMAFTRLLKHAWDLERIARKQAALSENGEDPLDNPAVEKEYDRYQRYYNRTEVSYYRAQRELRTLQTNRVLQQTLPAPLNLGTLPRLITPTQILTLAKRTHKRFSSLAINQLTWHTEQSDPIHPTQKEDQAA